MTNENSYRSNAYDELIYFIKQEIGAFRMTISRETLIENDLGITGNDAEKLILSFSKKFSVNINDFDFSKYFNDEPSVFLNPREIQPLKVGHLEEAIIKGILK